MVKTIVGLRWLALWCLSGAPLCFAVDCQQVLAAFTDVLSQGPRMANDHKYNAIAELIRGPTPEVIPLFRRQWQTERAQLLAAFYRDHTSSPLVEPGKGADANADFEETLTISGLSLRPNHEPNRNLFKGVSPPENATALDYLGRILKGINLQSASLLLDDIIYYYPDLAKVLIQEIAEADPTALELLRKALPPEPSPVPAVSKPSFPQRAQSLRDTILTTRRTVVGMVLVFLGYVYVEARPYLPDIKRWETVERELAEKAEAERVEKANRKQEAAIAAKVFIPKKVELPEPKLNPKPATVGDLQSGTYYRFSGDEASWLGDLEITTRPYEFVNGKIGVEVTLAEKNGSLRLTYRFLSVAAQASFLPDDAGVPHEDRPEAEFVGRLEIVSATKVRLVPKSKQYPDGKVSPPLTFQLTEGKRP